MSVAVAGIMAGLQGLSSYLQYKNRVKGNTRSEDAYIADLQSKRGQHLQYQKASQNINRYNQVYIDTANRMGQAFNRGDVSFSAKISATRNLTNDYNKFINTTLSEAGLQDREYDNRLDEQITQAKYQRNLKAEQNEAMEKQAKNEMVGGLAGATSTATGAILGRFFGGESGTELGMRYGMAGGQAIQGAIQQNYEMMTNGLSNAVGVYMEQNRVRRVNDGLKDIFTNLPQDASREEIMQAQMKFNALVLGYDFNKEQLDNKRGNNVISATPRIESYDVELDEKKFLSMTTEEKEKLMQQNPNKYWYHRSRL